MPRQPPPPSPATQFGPGHPPPITPTVQAVQFQRALHKAHVKLMQDLDSATDSRSRVSLAAGIAKLAMSWCSVAAERMALAGHGRPKTVEPVNSPKRKRKAAAPPVQAADDAEPEPEARD